MEKLILLVQNNSGFKSQGCNWGYSDKKNKIASTKNIIASSKKQQQMLNKTSPDV